MKTKHIILMLFACMMALPMQAQWKCYTNVGISPSRALSLRVGALRNDFGGELYVKSDINRVNKEMVPLNGSVYRLALMGGISYRLISNFMVTANVGYGAMGNYKVDATETHYGAENLIAGIEAGAGFNLIVGDGFMLYGGWSFLPIGGNSEYHNEYTVGLGYMFNL